MKSNDTKIIKKDLILETSKLVFAEKGFDGARMDEIAERAGVKKSLIYYHFEGKDHLLQEILNSFFEDFGKILRSEADDEVSAENKYMRFLDKNSDLLRVILIESLKKNTKLPSIFKVVEMLMDYEKEISNNSIAQLQSNHKRWVAEFFTSILPSVGFVCYKDAWCDYFGVDKDTVYKDFYESYLETHGEYHNKRGCLEK